MITKPKEYQFLSSENNSESAVGVNRTLSKSAYMNCEGIRFAEWNLTISAVTFIKSRRILKVGSRANFRSQLLLSRFPLTHFARQ